MVADRSASCLGWNVTVSPPNEAAYVTGQTFVVDGGLTALR